MLIYEYTRILLIKNKSGVILLLTLFILSGILIITLAAADLVLAGIRMNRLTGYSNLAFFAAEAGLERSLWEVRKNPSYVPPGPDETIKKNIFIGNLGNGSGYNVDYASSTPNVIYASTGLYREIKRSVAGTYQIQ